MLSGHNGGNFTATTLSRSAVERATGTPSMTAESPGMASAEKKLNKELTILTYLCEPVQKTGRQIHVSARIEVKYK